MKERYIIFILSDQGSPDSLLHTYIQIPMTVSSFVSAFCTQYIFITSLDC